MRHVETRVSSSDSDHWTERDAMFTKTSQTPSFLSSPVQSCLVTQESLSMYVNMCMVIERDLVCSNMCMVIERDLVCSKATTEGL